MVATLDISGCKQVPPAPVGWYSLSLPLHLLHYGVASEASNFCERIEQAFHRSWLAKADQLQLVALNAPEMRVIYKIFNLFLNICGIQDVHPSHLRLSQRS